MAEKLTISPHSEITPASVREGKLNVREDMNDQHLQNLGIQRKLSVGDVDDPLEHEADAMADKVMRMPETDFIQRKCAHCKEEEKLQRKPLISFIQKKSAENNNTVSDTISNQIQSTKGGGNPIPKATKTFMESHFGADFSKVNIHTGSYASQLSNQLNAQAFTVRNDIYFNEGKFSPQSAEGKHLLAHELAHTLQQMGSKTQAKQENNLIQRYFDGNGTAGSAVGHSYRISDDLTAAVKVGYPNHELYAETGKAAFSNFMLASVGSGIQLIEENTNFNVSQGSKVKTLKKVVPKNIRNSTSGDTMKISDDCGTSCSVVVGSKRRTALHYDAITKTHAETTATTPSLMKAEIMKKMLIKWLINASTSAPVKIEIADTLTKANAKQAEITAAEAAFLSATGADKEVKGDIYWAKVDEYGNIMMSFYNKMPESQREEIDKYLEINKFAHPNVGQGYTMSSGGTNYPGTSTWNFHWGGVVMKSTDQQDTITLENYAVPGDVDNDRWDLAMYGTAAKKGQTFHEQHHDTKQHGDRPTTMTIEKQ
jgi:hypothetical protein